jgi:hypothetical protein
MSKLLSLPLVATILIRNESQAVFENNGTKFGSVLAQGLVGTSQST